MSSNKFYSVACDRIYDIVKPHGFKKYNRYFYRITDDGVVQQFCVLWLYRTFTIRFRLSSVYDDNDRTCEGSEICQIIDGSNQWLSEGFPNELIYNLSDETYRQASFVCEQAIKEVLLPFFEETKNAKHAHLSMIKYDSFGEKEYDIRELGFFLLLEEYQKAKEILEYFIKNKNRWNQKWWGSVGTEYEKLIEAISSNQIEYLNEYKNSKAKKTYCEYKWKKT